MMNDSGIQVTLREGKGKSIIDFPSRYCVIDIETTGLSPKWNDIIEIGAIRYIDGVENERFQTLVKPNEREDGIWVDSFIESLTGITNEMLKDAPLTKDAVKMFADFLGDDIIVGYNVSFDINFLYDRFVEYLNKPLSNDFIDGLRMARKLYPQLPNHGLRDMVDVLKIQTGGSHRAIFDVESTQACYMCLVNEALTKYSSINEFASLFKKQSNNADARTILGDERRLNPDSPLYMKYCVFTGALEKMTRKEAMQLVANLGGINENSVTKKTNYLIMGNSDYCTNIKNGKSSKQKQAETYKLKGQNIEIIPETVFYDMLGEELVLFETEKKESIAEKIDPETYMNYGFSFSDDDLTVGYKGVIAYVTKMLSDDISPARLRFGFTLSGMQLESPCEIVNFKVYKKWTIKVWFKGAGLEEKEEVEHLTDLEKFKSRIVSIIKQFEYYAEWYERPENGDMYQELLENTYQIPATEIDPAIQNYIHNEELYKEQRKR